MKQKGPFVKGSMFWACDENSRKINKRSMRLFGIAGRKSARRYVPTPARKTAKVNFKYMDDDDDYP